MEDIVTVPRVFGAIAAFLMVDAFYRMFLIPTARLPFDKLLTTAKKRYNTSDDQPLRNKIAVVTGSTSGIGQQIAADLYRVI